MNSPLLAAIDVGTNSIHLVIARQGKGGRFETVTREKAVVRLGHGSDEMRHLEPAAISRGVEALARMGRLAAASGAPVRAVATSAVREAHNSEEFLRAARRVGVEVEVISGREEARLIHLGVLQAVPVYDRRILLVDIGGGSTEIVVGERGRELAARSFKLGAVRLSDRFFPDGAAPRESIDSCRSAIRSVLAAFEKEVARIGFDTSVVSSGTAEAVARVSHALTGADPLRTYNCYEFTREELDRVVETILAAGTTAERRLVPGLDPDRADIIVAGALVLEGVADTFGIEQFTFSDYALREGVLLDTLARQQGRATHHLRDVARRSVRHLAERCDDDLAHSAHVSELALQIFDGTAEMHGLPDEAREQLEAAALLANVGLVISHTKHHVHSYYVIRNSDDLVGFTDREIEMIALVARYHRKSAPKLSHDGYGRLDENDQRAVRVLSGILRVAIGLDRSHDQRVRRVSVDIVGRTVTLSVVARRRSDDLSLEFYSAGERSGLLTESLDARVELVRST